MKAFPLTTVFKMNRFMNQFVVKKDSIRRLSTHIKVNTSVEESITTTNQVVITPTTFPREGANPEKIKEFFDKSKAPSKRQPKPIEDPKLFVKSIEEKLQKVSATF